MESRRRIKRLDTEIANKIAAGEVVKRPANALKEMLENSLDANATSIQIVVKDGGMKYLHIQDNGIGIAKDDLDLVCERFATSKLEKFDELRSINTYGFRGEALCSISLVSYVTIITKTADERCGYKIIYRDGKIKSPPVPCGANQGTQITVENLFYNVPTRQKMLKNFNEEFNKIKDVVSSYAIHNASISFSLKKYGRDDLFIKTLCNSTCIDNIRSIFGNKVARDLLEANEVDDTLQIKYHILTTSLDYHAPQLLFLLFINHRLVDAEGLRKQLDLLYGQYLPQGTHPFIYLSIEMAAQNVDVNVHPTKHKVFYLHEEAINNKIRTSFQELIVASLGSRHFPVKPFCVSSLTNPLAHETTVTKNKTDQYPHEKVRIDASEQKIDRFLQPMFHTENNSISVIKSFSENVLNESSNKELMMSHIETDQTEVVELTLSEHGKIISPTDNALQGENNGEKIIDSRCTLLYSKTLDGDSEEIVGKVEIRNGDLVCETLEESERNCPKLSFLSLGKFSKTLEATCHNDIVSDLGKEKIIDCNADIGHSSKEDYNIPSSNNSVHNNQDSLSNHKKDNKHRNTQVGSETLGECKTYNISYYSSNAEVLLEIVCCRTTPKILEHQLDLSLLKVKREFSLTSLETLRKAVVDECDQELKRILRSGIYVGCLEYKYMLMQHGTNLYLCDAQHLCETFFYQVMLCEFGNFGVMRLSQPTSLSFLLKIALKGNYSTELDETLSKRLIENSEMLEDYFCIKIDKGNILSFPWLLEKYYPSISNLPEYILRLASHVNWQEEQACFQGICAETARFYSQLPSKVDKLKISKEWNWILEHILFPKIKRYIYPPKSFIKCLSLCHIARFKDLFSIFERC